MARATEHQTSRRRSDHPRRPGDADQRSLQSRIRRHYGALPDSERKLADLILDFPGEIAAYSATELAELAGASKAAVTRLTRRLGFASFEEARVAARDAIDWGSPVYLLSKHAHGEAFATRIKRHAKQDVANLEATFAGLDEALFNAVVEALATSRRIWLLGYRNSHFLAGYARWQLIQVRGDVHLFPAAGETLAEYLADLQAQDLLFAVGFRRRMPEIDRAIEIAMRSGARVLFITEPTARPLPCATWTIQCEVRGHDALDGYASAISVLHFLSVALVERMGKAGRRRLTSIEELHEELHELA